VHFNLGTLASRRHTFQLFLVHFNLGTFPSRRYTFLLFLVHFNLGTFPSRRYTFLLFLVHFNLDTLSFHLQPWHTFLEKRLVEKKPTLYEGKTLLRPPCQPAYYSQIPYCTHNRYTARRQAPFFPAKREQTLLQPQPQGC